VPLSLSLAVGVGLKALILVSSLALALDSPLMDPNDPLRHVLEVCDLVISWCAEKNYDRILELHAHKQGPRLSATSLIGSLFLR